MKFVAPQQGDISVTKYLNKLRIILDEVDNFDLDHECVILDVLVVISKSKTGRSSHTVLGWP